MHGLVAEAVRELQDPYRTVVVLRYFDGMSVREIAAHTGTNPATVHTRLRRALEQLRQRLDSVHRGSRRGWMLALAPLLVPHQAAAAAAVGGSITSKSLIAALVLIAVGVAGAQFYWLDRPDETRRAVASRGLPEMPTSADVSPEATPAFPTPEKAPPGPGRHVDLVLLDAESGRCVPGATVHVIHAGGKPNRALRTLLEAEDHGSNVHAMVGALHALDLIGMKDGRSIEVEPVTSDGAGHARITRLPKGTFVAVVLSADHVPQRIELDAGAPPATVRLSGGGGITIIARARDDLAGQELSCGFLVGSRTVAHQTLDEQGRAVIHHLAPGTYRVESGHGGTAGTPLAVRTVAVKKNSMTVVELDWTDRATISGRLLRGDQPESGGVAFLMFERDNALLVVGQLAEDGTYRFEDLPAGRYKLSIAVDSGSLIHSEFETAAGTPNQTHDLTVPAGMLTGTVVDLKGKPIAGAGLVIEPHRRGGEFADATGEATVIRGLIARVKTDDTGRYSIDALAAGEYRITYGTGGAYATTAVRIAEGEHKELALRFDAGSLAELDVRAVDEQGKPVRAQFLLRGAHGELGELYATDNSPLPALRLAGRVPRDEYRVWIAADGYAVVHARSINVTGREPIRKALARGVPVTLHTGRAHAALEILDPHGNRVSTASNGLEFMRATTLWLTDAEGTVRLARVAPGVYTVRLDGAVIGTVAVASEPVEHRIEN